MTGGQSDQRQSVEDCCDWFEAEWKAGRRPILQQILSSWQPVGSKASAEQLFRYLLELEVDYRRRAGETVAAGDYETEFADYRPIIWEVVEPSGVADTLDQQASNTRPKVAASHQSSPGAFGGYELLDVLGKGGMGVVYRARQTGLNRLVAIKMLLSGGQASTEEVQRFQAEAEAAAKLDHPNIVPIYEVGERDGQRFFSMAYVEGPSLAQRMREEPFTPRLAAEMTRNIAAAVHYAHTQGIIHRDLKPANILLGLDGRPRVSDFGLAKTLENNAELTTTGQILGTPSYMAPEQAMGKVSEISPRSDVYALGAILYEALVGRPPFRDSSVWETIRQVIHSDPVTPRLLNRSVPRDLETIVLKALEKEPAARFASAQDLADDLGRFLSDEPIFARPVSRTEKCFRWVRKNRTVSTLAATLLGLLLLIGIGSAGSATMIRWQESQRTKLAGEKDQLQTQKTNLEQQTTTLKKQSRAERYFSDMLLAADALRISTGIGRVREFVDPWDQDREQPDLRGWEWHFLRSAAHEEFDFIEIKTTQGLNVPLSTIAFHPREEVVAVGAATGDLYVGPIDDATQIQFASDHELHITNLVWRPDGERVATASLDGKVFVWMPDPLQKVDEIDFGKIVFAVDYSPDGKWLAVMVQDDGVHILNAETKERIAHLTDKVAGQSTIKFSPHGELLAIAAHLGGDSYEIHLWNTATWQNESLANKKPFVGHKQQINRIVWSQKGDRLLTASFDRTIKEWSVSEQQLLRSFDTHTAQVTSAQYARQERDIVSVGWDYAFRRFDILSGKQTYLGRGHIKRAQWSSLNSEGDLLATVGEDGVIRLWDLQDPRAAVAERKHAAKSLEDPYPQIVWKHDGQQLAASLNSTTCWWNGDENEAFAVGAGALPEWSAGDEYLSRWEGDVLHVRETRGRQQTRTFQAPEQGFGHCRSVWSTKGTRLLISTGSRLFLWDLSQPEPREFARNLNSVKGMAWSPSDEQVLITGTDGVVKIFQTGEGKELQSFQPHPLSHAVSVAWSPSGEQFITCSPDRTAIVWNVQSREKVCTLADHSFTVNQAAWSPDGQRIATAGGDSTVRIWTAAGEQSLILRHPDQVVSLAWSADGRRLASLSQDGTVLVHDAALSYEHEQGKLK